MLTANRFKNVPTEDCRNRLEKALSNERPIARGEQHRGAVIAIQSALADLNRGYLLTAEIDGYFGSRTYGAVEAFQRDYGLIADGIVGRQTLTQLDSLYGGTVVRQPRGLSVHVGVDRVDPAHYGGEFKLASCVNDARRMCEIAERLGYEPVVFENEQATVSNFTGFMRGAISNLYDGDSVLVTFSGHGSQIPNNSPDVEADDLDETLCFFDRMLVDDEFHALLAQFREGVRVHAVFDSCHSGTVAKAPVSLELEQERVAYEKKTLEALKGAVAGDGGLASLPEDNRPFTSVGVSKALSGDRPDFAKEPKRTKSEDDKVAALFADLHAERTLLNGKRKQIGEGDWRRIYNNNKSFYDAIKNVVGPQENQQILCSVVTLSACQDSQTTPAGELLSLFTYNVSSTWTLAGFEGSYSQFHSNLVKIAASDAIPAINTYGPNRANARLYERPFVF